MTIIDRLRTPIATLLVLCAALLSQMPHAADVFRLIVGGEGWGAVLHGYAYAIALELAVLLFVVQRRDLESYLFAGVSILVNLSYYSLHGIDLFTVASAPAWLVSIALPSAIARYSHLLVDEPRTVAQEPAKPLDAPATMPQAVDADLPQVDATAQPAPPDVAHLVSLSNAAIAEHVNVSRQTVSQWRRKGVLDVKLLDKLPAIAQPHTNGATVKP